MRVKIASVFVIQYVAFHDSELWKGAWVDF